MAGGQLGIIIATTAIIFAYLGARVWTRVIRPELRPNDVFGDVVEVPQEMRPVREYGGGSPSKGGRADANNDRFALHVGERL